MNKNTRKGTSLRKQYRRVQICSPPTHTPRIPLTAPSRKINVASFEKKKGEKKEKRDGVLLTMLMRPYDPLWCDAMQVLAPWEGLRYFLEEKYVI